MIVTPHCDAFTKALCEALGLKLARKIVITAEVDGATVVEAECYVEKGSLDVVARRFKLTATPVGGPSAADAA